MIRKKNNQHLVWMGSSRKDLQKFPREVKKDIGFALWKAQQGKKPISVKPLKGFKGSSVLEIVEDYRTDTYRAVYTTKFDDIIYVLSCFQKKSKKAGVTPKKEMDLIYRRLKEAREDYQNTYK